MEKGAMTYEGAPGLDYFSPSSVSGFQEHQPATGAATSRGPPTSFMTPEEGVIHPNNIVFYIYEGVMDNTPDELEEVLPLLVIDRRKGPPKIKWIRFTTQRQVPGELPYRSAPNLITSSFDERTGSVVRKGLMITYSNDDVQSIDGRFRIQSEVRAIAGAVRTDIRYDRLSTLLNSESLWKKKGERGKQYPSVYAALRDEIMMWGVLTKTPRGFSIMDAKKRSELQQRGFQPTHWILPSGTAINITSVQTSETSYKEGGPAFDRFKTKPLGTIVKPGYEDHYQMRYRGTKVLEVATPFIQSPQGNQYYPTRRKRVIADYGMMFYWDHIIDDYSSNKMTIYMTDASKGDGDFSPITLLQCLEHCPLFENDGSLRNLRNDQVDEWAEAWGYRKNDDDENGNAQKPQSLSGIPSFENFLAKFANFEEKKEEVQGQEEGDSGKQVPKVVKKESHWTGDLSQFNLTEEEEENVKVNAAYYATKRARKIVLTPETVDQLKVSSDVAKRGTFVSDDVDDDYYEAVGAKIKRTNEQRTEILETLFNREALKKLINDDFPIPMQFILIRAAQQWEMESGVMCKGGPELGRTFMTNNNWQVGHDVTVQEWAASYTANYKTHIHRPRMVSVARDIAAREYISGEDVTFAKAGDDNDPFVSGSIIVLAVPPNVTMHDVPDPLPLVDNVSSKLNIRMSKIVKDALKEKRKKIWGKLYDGIYQWEQHIAPSSDEDKFGIVNEVSIPPVAFRTTQYIKDSKGEASIVIHGTGHWGGNVQPGFMRSRLIDNFEPIPEDALASKIVVG